LRPISNRGQHNPGIHAAPGARTTRLAMAFSAVLGAVLPSLAALTALPGLESTAAAQDDRGDWLDIEVGKSVVIETPKNATAIAITDPSVADIVPLASANKIQVQGKAVGSTDLVIQQGSGVAPLIYEVTVHQDLSDLIRRIDAVVEGEPPSVYPLKDRIVVQGPVDDLDTLEHVAQIASTYDDDFINLMTVRGDHQVQLEVTFAEVSRSQLRELGMNVLWGDDARAAGLLSPNFNSAATVTGGPTQVISGVTPAATSGAFQLLAFVGDIDLSAVLSVLEDYSLSKILAQPTLSCLSGQQCEFLAGGELPLPGAGGSGTVSITYKEYGVKLVFVPTVLAGNVVDMRVYVEVSEPDYGNGSRLTGIEVPGFISRKGKSHLRLDSGMTFAMAGMISETTTYSRASVPVLGDIPIIGTLFRFTRHQRREQELVIFVTPRLIRPLGPGEVPPPPGVTEDNNPSDFELYLLGMDHRPGSRTADATGPTNFGGGMQR
jgi:pilus assembly protein CpaC